MAAYNNEVIQRVASTFAQCLIDEIGVDNVMEVNRRNKLPQYHGCCASHDFCDSNMVMDQRNFTPLYITQGPANAFGQRLMPDCTEGEAEAFEARKEGDL